MRIILKSILKFYLKSLAKLVLLTQAPEVIAIAGSTNKSFAKEKIVKILAEQGIEARYSKKNFNTEIGLSLAILDIESGYGSYAKWLEILPRGIMGVFRKIPKVLVLELGISDPGDARYLRSIINPDYLILTDLTQRYLEGFMNMDELSKEYVYLIKKMKAGGMVILNNDNQRLRAMKKEKQAITFGFRASSHFLIKRVEESAGGQTFYFNYNQKEGSFHLKEHGAHHVSAAAIALIIKDSLCSRLIK